MIEGSNTFLCSILSLFVIRRTKLRLWFKLREIELRVLVMILKCVKRGRFFYFMYAILRGCIIVILSFIPSHVHDKCSISYNLKKLQNYFAKLNKLALVEVHGIRFVVMDYEALNIVLPEFERDVSRYINYVSSKHREGVFLDVGAHVGKYSIAMAKRGWRVIALEPHPLNYSCLTLNARINGCDIEALPLAAFSSKRTLKLFLGDYSGRHSVIREGKKYILVRAEPIDDILYSIGIPFDSVKLVKIDVEGAAVEVLKGMLNLMKYAKPDIIIEISREERAAIGILKSLGYKIIPIIDKELGTFGGTYYAYAEKR